MLAKHKAEYLTLVSLALVFLVVLSTEAGAKTFEFKNVSANNTADAAAGEAQLTVDVTAVGSNKVMFTFINSDTISDPQQMFIRNVYFYDGMLSDPVITGPTTENEVAFTDPSKPEALPGFEEGLLTAFFAADRDTHPAGSDWGVNVGEYLSITFTYDPLEYSYAALLSDIGSEDVILGIKVQGFEGGGSESFVTPIPPSVILSILGLGVVGLGLKLRKHA